MAEYDNNRNGDNRQFERDFKYFQDVLGRVDEGVELPYSLTSGVLLSRLDGVEPADDKLAAVSTLLFLRSKLFSLQSVVSYAVAFMLIAAVAYGLRSGNEDVISGNIVLQQPASMRGMAAESELHTADDEAALESGAEIFAADSANVTSPANQDKSASGQLQAPQSITTGEVMGVGGGGETVKLGQDDKYVYMCRYNDRTDPDRADSPITVELIGVDTNESAGFINVPDIENLPTLHLFENVVCLVGAYGGDTVSRVYSIEALQTGGEAAEICTASQPGEYVASHLFDGVLRVATIYESEDAAVESETLLPDAASLTRCVITAVDIAGGESAQMAYVGVDRGVSLHEHNIYMTYGMTPDADGHAELHMVQIPLEGLNLEMVLVP